MQAELIVTTFADDVATIRLNDPATVNALSYDMADALRDALLDAQTRSRAIVLCGNARGFSAGAKLTSVDLHSADFDAGAMLESHYHPLMSLIRDLRVPLVTAVRGAAAGIGASLALAADIIVAGESAIFLQAFRRIGLIPDGGSAFLLCRAVGRVRAMELMLLGEKLPASQALQWGLINRLVADAEVENEAARIAAELAHGPTVALGLIRRLGWLSAEAGWQESLIAERRGQREAGNTWDFREGVSAFLEKRTANFRGR
jgi:2-(1,2-epoxy-1,2-dihydrophenyl)acetyl-CoA isomerase